MNRELFVLFKNEIARYPILSREEECCVALRASAGDLDARNRLIVSNLRFVLHQIFKRWHADRFPGLQLMDLVSEGYMGLMKASKTFNPSTGFRFVSYASPAIKHSISTALWSWKRNRHDSLDEPIFKDNNEETKKDRLPSEDLKADEKYACEQVKELLSFLSKREFEIINLRYWHDMSYDEAGRRLGISGERVRQSENKALRKLRWHAKGIMKFGSEGFQVNNDGGHA